MNKKLILFLLPLALFIAMTGFLFSGLFSDPTERESALIGKPIPEFQLPDLMVDGKQYNQDSLKGEAYLINVWGTWCPTCNAELAYLTQLRKQGVKIIGLYYEQDIDPDFGETFDINLVRADVESKLASRGNPFALNMLDLTRSMSLDLGVTGAPETFLVDKNGIIRFHHVGEINARVWRGKFAALWQEVSGG